MHTTLVLGIGNTLLTDEGIGVHVVDYLRRHYPDLPGVTYLDGGTLSFTLAGPIEETDYLIVVDASELKAAPGTVKVFHDLELDRFLSAGGKRSVHEVGLMDLMDIARLTEQLPARRALVGVQPLELDWGDWPSAPVAAAIPAAAEQVLQILSVWNEEEKLI